MLHWVSLQRFQIRLLFSDHVSHFSYYVDPSCPWIYSHFNLCFQSVWCRITCLTNGSRTSQLAVVTIPTLVSNTGSIIVGDWVFQCCRHLLPTHSPLLPSLLPSSPSPQITDTAQKLFTVLKFQLHYFKWWRKAGSVMVHSKNLFCSKD